MPSGVVPWSATERSEEDREHLFVYSGAHASEGVDDREGHHTCEQAVEQIERRCAEEQRKEEEAPLDSHQGERTDHRLVDRMPHPQPLSEQPGEELRGEQ